MDLSEGRLRVKLNFSFPLNSINFHLITNIIITYVKKLSIILHIFLKLGKFINNEKAGF